MISALCAAGLLAGISSCIISCPRATAERRWCLFIRSAIGPFMLMCRTGSWRRSLSASTLFARGKILAASYAGSGTSRLTFTRPHGETGRCSCVMRGPWIKSAYDTSGIQSFAPTCASSHCITRGSTSGRPSTICPAAGTSMKVFGSLAMAKSPLANCSGMIPSSAPCTIKTGT